MSIEEYLRHSTNGSIAWDLENDRNGTVLRLTYFTGDGVAREEVVASLQEDVFELRARVYVGTELVVSAPLWIETYAPKLLRQYKQRLGEKDVAARKAYPLMQRFVAYFSARHKSLAN